eukprot:UN31535
MVRFILSHKDVNVNAQNRYGKTALMRAVSDYHSNYTVDIVRLLLGHRNINLNIQEDTEKRSALHALLDPGCGYNSETLSMLKSFLQHKHIDVNLQCVEGETPLMLIISHIWSEHGNQFSFGGNKRDRYKHKIDVNVLRTLLSHKNIDINQKDASGTTALMSAIMIVRHESKYFDLVKVLLNRRDINLGIKDEVGDSVLTMVLNEFHDCDSVNIIKILLSHENMYVNLQHRIYGDGSALHALFLSHREPSEHTVNIVKHFVNHRNFNVNLQDGGGDTALVCGIKQLQPS